jgi:hypothetical protein
MLRTSIGFRARRTLFGAVALGGLLMLGASACGDDDECNHVISDVISFEQCMEIAVERSCSPDIVWRRSTMRCKVVNCGDCKGPRATPTATPEEG